MDWNLLYQKKKWTSRGHSAGGEYGKTVWINYSHPKFADYFSDLVLEKTSRFDGVMLDWWHNEHPGASKNNKKARRKIAEAIKNKMGKEFIILANVNWFGDGDTHDLINGVFMELSKTKKTSSAYSCNEIAKIEKLIKFHDQNLLEPRIIAVNTWRITKKFSSKYNKWEKMELFLKDRSSPENIQFAKLFTAMAMVIPENGYILYGDNNPDRSDVDDHGHTYYDFYNTDLGKAISDEVEITEGVAYKKYEKGLIAYNRTKFKYTVKFKDGKKVEIGPLEGVFVKD